MHVCSTEEGMMAKPNVTNDHSSPLPLVCFLCRMKTPPRKLDEPSDKRLKSSRRNKQTKKQQESLSLV